MNLRSESFSSHGAPRSISFRSTSPTMSIGPGGVLVPTSPRTDALSISVRSTASMPYGYPSYPASASYPVLSAHGVSMKTYDPLSRSFNGLSPSPPMATMGGRSPRSTVGSVQQQQQRVSRGNLSAPLSSRTASHRVLASSAAPTGSVVRTISPGGPATGSVVRTVSPGGPGFPASAAATRFIRQAAPVRQTQAPQRFPATAAWRAAQRRAGEQQLRSVSGVPSAPILSSRRSHPSGTQLGPTAKLTAAPQTYAAPAEPVVAPSGVNESPSAVAADNTSKAGDLEELRGRVAALKQDITGIKEAKGSALAKVELREALPDGWEAIFDSSSGCEYYYNRDLNSSQWEKPDEGEDRHEEQLINAARNGDSFVATGVDINATNKEKEKTFLQGTAVAQQREGFPEVFLKNDDGKLTAKIKNGLTVNIVQQDDTRFKVDCGGQAGWAQKGNFRCIDLKAASSQKQPSPTCNCFAGIGSPRR